MSVWIGLDPGIHGACVALNDRGLLVCAHPLPVVGPPKKRRLDVVAFDRLLATLDDGKESGECSAAIEELMRLPASMSFGSDTSWMLYGAMMAVLELRNWPIRTVRPRGWQKTLDGLPSKPKCDSKDPKVRERARQAHKRAFKAAVTAKAFLACPELRAEAQRIGGKPDGLADAYHIAQWGRANS